MIDPANNAPTLRDHVAKWERSILKNLPAGVDPARFMSGFRTCQRFSPRIAQCTRDSIVNTLLQMAQLGLIPTAPGPAATVALVPRENRKKGLLELSAIVQYPGLRQLAERSGAVRAVACECVYANDYFDIRLGAEPYCEHRPALKMRGALIGAYTVITLRSGEKQLTWLPREDADGIRDRYARAHDEPASPWLVSYPEMVRKTCFRRAMKYVPLTTDLAEAITRADVAEYGDRAGAAAGAIAGATIEGTAEQVSDAGGADDHPDETKEQSA